MNRPSARSPLPATHASSIWRWIKWGLLVAILAAIAIVVRVVQIEMSMSTIFDGPMIVENDGRSARRVQLTAMARRRQELENTIAGVTDA
jgi:hypothetical protein